MELLAGEDNYVTQVVEEGYKYRLDFSKVYSGVLQISHNFAPITGFLEPSLKPRARTDSEEAGQKLSCF